MYVPPHVVCRAGKCSVLYASHRAQEITAVMEITYPIIDCPRESDEHLVIIDSILMQLVCCVGHANCVMNGVQPLFLHLSYSCEGRALPGQVMSSD